MKKVLSFLAIAAVLCCVACKKDNGGKNKENNKENNKEQQEPEKQEPEVQKATVTIDGNFDDWAKLDQTKVAVAKSDPASPWDVIKEIRCYSNEMFVFLYVEFDSAQVADITGGDGFPMRINLNVDGEFESGYAKYSLDAYDFITEGSLAANGEWLSYDGTLFQRIDGDWAGGDDGILAAGNGLTSGAGAGNKYEICLVKEIFNAAAGATTVPMVMGDSFEVGLRFYTASWGELANMPDGAVTDDNSNGWGHLLKVTTDK